MDAFLTVACVAFGVCIIYSTGVNAACNANSLNKIVFQEINETEWDRSWTDIAEDGKRPLGFQKGTAYFNSPDLPNPCIEVPDADNRHILILVESPTGLFIRLKNQDNVDERITKTYRKCPLATASRMFYEFYVDPSGGGSESDVSFWYKFTKGPTRAEDPESMWCDEVKVEYPGSLRPLPTNFIPDVGTDGPAGAAPNINTSVISVITCTIAIYLCK